MPRRHQAAAHPDVDSESVQVAIQRLFNTSIMLEDTFCDSVGALCKLSLEMVSMQIALMSMPVLGGCFGCGGGGCSNCEHERHEPFHSRLSIIALSLFELSLLAYPFTFDTVVVNNQECKGERPAQQEPPYESLLY
jgi:hypothetical protein